MAESINNFNYLNKLLYSLVFIGYVIILFFPEGSLFGYSFVTGSIGLIYILSFLQEVSLEKTKIATTGWMRFWDFLKMVVRIGWPIILLFLIMSWVVFLNAKFNNHIKDNNTTAQYKAFSGINLVLLSIQLYLIHRYMKASVKEENIKVSEGDSVTGRLLSTFLTNVPYLILFVSLIQITVVGIMDINLSNFTTDG